MFDSFEKLPGEEAVVMFMFEQDHPPPRSTSLVSTWSPGFKGPARLVIDFKGKDPNSSSQEPGRTGRTLSLTKHNKWRPPDLPAVLVISTPVVRILSPHTSIYFSFTFSVYGKFATPIGCYGYCGETFFPKTEASEAQAQS